MADQDLSLCAILHELNAREFRKRLGLFPEALRYYVMLAHGLIGLENARRVAGTPPAVIEDSDGFVRRLLGIVDPAGDETFGEVLLTCLIETLKGELRFSCLNCRAFASCLQLEHLPVGGLFEKRVRGDESPGLKDDVRRAIDAALVRTPYIECDDAQFKCDRFTHCHPATELASLFRRYRDIAEALAGEYALDFARFLAHVVTLNMEFFRTTRASPQDPPS